MENNLTLMDHGKRIEPGGKVAKVTELLSQRNEILDDMIFLEANDGSSHITTVRVGEPEATWRMLNRGVKNSKSTTAQISDSCGMLEVYSTVDADLVKRASDKNAFLLSESKPFVNSMSKKMARTLFYGDTSKDKAAFIGLSARYKSLSRENPEFEDTSDYIIDAGGTGNNLTSIWVVVWSDDSAHGIFPKGSQAGVQQDYKGQVTVQDDDGRNFEAHRTHFKWDLGFVLRDFRQVVRIANVPKDLTSVNLTALLIKATEKVEDPTAGKLVIYCNREVRTALRLQISEKGNVQYTSENVGGKIIDHLIGYPVRRVDVLMNNEVRVV